MGMKERSEERRKRMVVHVAQSFKEAEEWDLEYWQGQTPEKRIEAFCAILGDVETVQQSRPAVFPDEEFGAKHADDVVRDFEGILRHLEAHQVRYMIVGGLAFTYHVKPRYSDDLDLWIDAVPDNIARANEALRDFGTACVLDPAKPDEAVRVGNVPGRIDLFLNARDFDFNAAWPKRVRGPFVSAPANWIDMDSLIEMKSQIETVQQREDVRYLALVRSRRGY